MTPNSSQASDTDPAVAKDLDLLADPPATIATQDLASALSGPPPSARALRLTRVLVAGLILALGFAGGVLADQTWGVSGGASGPIAARPMGMPTGMPTGLPNPGAAGGSATTGTAGGTGTGPTTTTGTVTLVDGSVIYLTDPTGTQTRVEVGDKATITKTSNTTLSTIDKGDTVTATGTTDDDSLVATSVEVAQ
jgi:hypothetical protein